MRLSLLRAREPFGQILERTLSAFWTKAHGREHKVSWRDGVPWPLYSASSSRQTWICNGYINSIFTPDVAAEVFGPIRREFVRSVAPWRRPLQKAYVSAASHRWAAPWLACAHIEVTPGIGASRHQIIVPGNHKLRILDHKSGEAWSIMKDGFDPQFLRRESEARQQAVDVGVSVPPIKKIAEEGTWFTEQYVSGTPTNRLADAQRARRAEHAAAAEMHKLREATGRSEEKAQYAAQLLGRVEKFASANHLATREQKWQWTAVAQKLARVVESNCESSRTIETALSHGDFQPGNILVADDRIWIIDWEYSARRQQAYDLLVLLLRSRLERGLAERVMAFVQHGPLAEHDALWSRLDVASRSTRGVIVGLFWLEEMVLHLEENSNPRFRILGSGLLSMMHEAQSWVAQL